MDNVKLINLAIDYLDTSGKPNNEPDKPVKGCTRIGYLYEDREDRKERRKYNDSVEYRYNRDKIYYLAYHYTKEQLLDKLLEYKLAEDYNSKVSKKIVKLENKIEELKDSFINVKKLI